MTRRKKTKAAASGDGAAAVSAPMHDNASGSDVTVHNEPTCPYTGYSLLGPRPVYPVLAPRPVLTPAPRPAHALQAPKPVHPSTRPHPMHPVSGPRPVNAASGLHPVHPKQASPLDHKASSGPRPVKSAVGPGPVTKSRDHSVVNTSTSGSSAETEVASSVVSVSSTNTSDSKDNKTKIKPKQKYKIKVTYETKQIHIYPRQPILMVERLKELEHHVGVLTEAVGRRPSVYPHGRGVRFVPETEAEYATIQRYLARIEVQERIAWCSYSVPPGNSLKVNVKVRVVERTKITDDLTKLKLHDDKSEDSSEKSEKGSDAKSAVTSKQNGMKAPNSSPNEKSNLTSNGAAKSETKRYQNDAAVNTISTSGSGQFDSKTKEKQQADAKVKLVSATGSVQQSNKKNVKTVGPNQSAVKPRQRGSIQDNILKKKTETDEATPGLKTEHERDNKLLIVGVVRTNKMF